MIEKLVAIVAMISSMLALMGLSTLNFPTFFIILLALICTLIFLVGNVFLFADGTVLTSTRKAKTSSRVVKTMEVPEI